MGRPSIGMIVANAGRALQANAGIIARAAVLNWLNANRAELLAALSQADSQRGAAFLDAFCTRFPWAAGVIATAMDATPDQALDAIASYSPELAQELAPHKEQFAQLQEYWRAEKSSQE